MSWYAEGLKFGCTGCGECCRGPSGYVWVGMNDIETMAEAMKMSLDGFGRKYLRRCGTRMALVDGPDGNCIFLNNGKCKLYDARPIQCKTFPWWPENMKSEEAWEMLKLDCPGVGKGRTHSAATIDKALASLVKK